MDLPNIPDPPAPTAPENPPAGNAEISPDEGSLPPPEGSYAILVVDDEILIREVVEKELTQAGYKVVSAAEGQEALVKADTGTLWGPRGIPDLIIADIMMPVMDGFEFCQRVKQDPRLKPVPFLFLSAKRETLDRARAFILGGQRFIVKPFTRRVLLKAVNERLVDARQTRALLAKQEQAFDGDLIDYTVLSLVDLFLTGAWTGTLTIHAQTKEGRVDFQSGEIIRVRWDEKEGEEALADLLAQVEGTFKVERSPAASPLIPVLEAPADELKIEHSGRMESTPPAPAELPVLDAPSDELKIEHTGEQI
jgi:CheY-like chemotaxis protein